MEYQHEGDEALAVADKCWSELILGDTQIYS